MKKNLIEIYALAVCFFTVACFVIVAGMTTWDVVELTAPEFTIHNNEYEAHLSDQQYRDWLTERNSYKDEAFIAPSGKDLTDARNTSWQQVIKGEQRSALQSFVQNCIILVIDFFVFMAHWIIARKSREILT